MPYVNTETQTEGVIAMHWCSPFFQSTQCARLQARPCEFAWHSVGVQRTFLYTKINQWRLRDLEGWNLV